jgi:hypothetical protein
MDEDSTIAVSPRHSVRLASEYVGAVQRAPRRDFVVRTLAKREANGVPLMSAEIVIAGEDTRAEFPLAVKYPLHFRKTYFSARLHGDPRHEFECQARATELIDVPPPIGFGERVFRACLVPGKPYGHLSPFKAEPEERNLRHARELQLLEAAGHWQMMELAFESLLRLHRGGLAHGDTELRNFVVCPSPLELVPIDFEAGVVRESTDEAVWEERCSRDLDPVLRQAVLLQCGLGAQSGKLAEYAAARISRLFKDPQRFLREIGRQSDLEP